MTTVHRRRRRNFAVRSHDWGARAHCPECDRLLADFRYSVEGEGFYLLADFTSEPPRPVALVYTASLVRTVTLDAAEQAAKLCASCYAQLFAPRSFIVPPGTFPEPKRNANGSQVVGITAADAHSNTGFLSQYETDARAVSASRRCQIGTEAESGQGGVR